MSNNSYEVVTVMSHAAGDVPSMFMFYYPTTKHEEEPKEYVAEDSIINTMVISSRKKSVEEIA